MIRAGELRKAVKEGRIKESTIDNSVDRTVEAVFELSQEREKIDDKGFKKHNDLAYIAAAESAVLLKNSDNILPLKLDTRVALIGDFAYVPRYQGSGSSVVNATSVEHMNMLISNTTLHVVGCTRGYLCSGGIDAIMEKAAIDLAEQADVVIYCFGLDELSESEGVDRNHMRIPAESDTFA